MKRSNNKYNKKRDCNQKQCVPYIVSNFCMSCSKHQDKFCRNSFLRRMPHFFFSIYCIVTDIKWIFTCLISSYPLYLRYKKVQLLPLLLSVIDGNFDRCCLKQWLNHWITITIFCMISWYIYCFAEIAYFNLNSQRLSACSVLILLPLRFIWFSDCFYFRFLFNCDPINNQQNFYDL